MRPRVARSSMAASSPWRGDKPRNERSSSKTGPKTAVVSGLYGPAQPGAQIRILLRDAVQGVLDALLNGTPSTVDGRVGAPGSAPASGRAGKLARDRLHLVPKGRGAIEIAAF